MKNYVLVLFLCLLFVSCKLVKRCPDFVTCTKEAYIEVFRFEIVDKNTGVNLIENGGFEINGVQLLRKNGNDYSLGGSTFSTNEKYILEFSTSSLPGKNEMRIVSKTATIDFTYSFKEDKGCCPGPGTVSDIAFENYQYSIANSDERIVVKL